MTDTDIRVTDAFQQVGKFANTVQLVLVHGRSRLGSVKPEGKNSGCKVTHLRLFTAPREVPFNLEEELEEI